MKVMVPPIKSQGIKTKLVPWIKDVIPEDFSGTWIEPFMGTGAVAFNLAPRNALLCDTNPHLINFYVAIQSGEITHTLAKEFLAEEGEKLSAKGEEHYYAVRERFNQSHAPLDFLFLNRAGFNGMIRFNRHGKFNIPFCRKPNRFAQAYITKIVNQIAWVETLLKSRDFTFKCQDFEKTINEASAQDVIYSDPPYIGRHVDYFNGWTGTHEQNLFDALSNTKARFILSTWHHNDYRANEYIESLWGRYNVLTKEHFYHVGGREDNRNPMIEALVTNYYAAETRLREQDNIIIEALIPA
jgi:DNA adenine methylase